MSRQFSSELMKASLHSSDIPLHLDLGNLISPLSVSATSPSEVEELKGDHAVSLDTSKLEIASG